jgi:predicted MFS family arabinose efflux permease
VVTYRGESSLVRLGLSTFAGSLTGPGLARRIGIRAYILFGTAMGAAGLFWLAAVLDPHVAYRTHLLGPLILFGFGSGSAPVPMTLAATQDLPPHQAGLASGLINTSRQIVGAVGVAVWPG